MDGFAGFLIREKRLEHNWSQQGLCKGICAVSYLSKIEQGKAQPEESLLQLLFARLEICWQRDEAVLESQRQLVEQAYACVFSFDTERAQELSGQLKALHKDACYGPLYRDYLVLLAYFTRDAAAVNALTAAFFTGRQKTV